MTRILLAALLVAGLPAASCPAALSAAAEPATMPDVAALTARFRGTVVAADNERLAIRRAGGSTLDLAMNPRTRVYAVTPAQIRDIKPESYLSVLASAGPEPRRATAVTVYAPSERGFEAGSRPWDSAPGATLTAGSVADLAGGEPLRATLSWDGGQAAFEIPPGTPVTQFGPGEKAQLEPGAAVTVFARGWPDGSLEADLVAVGRQGAVPGL